MSIKKTGPVSPVPMGPEPGPSEVRLEITSYMHRLLARTAGLADMMPIEDCFWQGVSDGWGIFQMHHQTTPWVRLPEMHEPELVRVVARLCDIRLILLPRLAWRRQQIESDLPVLWMPQPTKRPLQRQIIGAVMKQMPIMRSLRLA